MSGYQAVAPSISALPVATGGRCFHWSSPVQPEKVSIVALHGFGGSGEDFQICADFSKEFPVSWTAPDLPCHGTAASGGLWEAQKTVAACKEAHHEEAPVLLGYSQGARLALHVALADPARWRALVLIGGSPGLKSETERRNRRANDEALARFIEAEGTLAFERDWQSKPLIATQRRIPEPWQSAIRERRATNAPTELAAALRQLGTGVLPSVWKQLKRLTLPVLVCFGEEDSKFGALAMDMCQELPNGLPITVPQAGHAPHLENPQMFLSLVYNELLQD